MSCTDSFLSSLLTAIRRGLFGQRQVFIAGVIGFCFISVSPAVGAEAPSASLDKGASPQSTPIGVYHHVWQLIKDNFYEPDYNGQKWTRWEHRYDKRLKDMNDARVAINSMLLSLGDRYTRYLDPSAFDNEKEQISAKLFGIGIQMGLNKEHKLIVIAPIEDMPAAKAGLLPSDEIVEIDGKTTNGLTVEQASKAIRGEIGTPVVLTVIRNKEKLTFKITRDEIPIRSVHNVMMLTPEIGYIRLGTFMSERASEELRSALDRLTPARGIIIDLRNNPGGLVTNAIDICSMFLPSSYRNNPVIVSTIDRNQHVQSARTNGKIGPISNQALVVLINENSASASEITSGALHDSRRAELVGQKSFGKGLVQSITRLEDGGGVNITIARYLTPNGIDIHKKGIVPDYAVELKPEDYMKGRGPWFIYGKQENTADRAPGDGKDIQLSKALEVMKDHLSMAASAPTIRLNPSGGAPEDAGRQSGLPPALELKISPFPSNNPFPNNTPISPDGLSNGQ